MTQIKINLFACLIFIYSVICCNAAVRVIRRAQMAATNPIIGNSEQSTSREGRGDSFKGYTGYRLKKDSRLGLYFHDLTIAVLELGSNQTLHNCELIEVFSDDQRKQVLRDMQKLLGRAHELPFLDMINLMGRCEQLDPKLVKPTNTAVRNAESNDDDSSQTSYFSGIIPGTKWCGPGDIAENYYDLGREKKLDQCCRRHDLCPVKVRSNGYRYNLSNKSRYTISHCFCDEEFANCLRRSHNSLGDLMGNIYYNFLRIQCIAESKNGRHFTTSKSYSN